MRLRSAIADVLFCAALAIAPCSAVAQAPAQAVQANGAITGRVRDANGNPVADVSVSAGDYDTAVNCGGCPYGTRTRNDGTYRLEVPPGTYLVYVNTHGRAEHLVPQVYLDVRSWLDISRAQPVSVASGKTAGGVNLRLASGFLLSGRLVDAQGQPVRNAGGCVRDPDQRIEFGCLLGFASSQTGGGFAVTVPVGVYDLSFALGSEGRWVRYGITVTRDVDLGDVLFSDAPVPAAVFNPRVVETGYTVETIVPGAPNVTCDLAVTGDGSIYLAAPGSPMVYKVALSGAVTAVAPVGVFALDAAADGNLYGYFEPEGALYRITRGGQVTRLATVPASACESSMTVGPAPELDLWVGLNDCSGTSLGQGKLFRVTQGGEVHSVAADLPFGINGLDFAPDGRFYVTIVDGLYRVNPANGQRVLIARLPQHSATHGLVAAPTGEFYVSSTTRDADRVYRVSASGQVSVRATLPSGYIMGLERLPGGDLIAAMRATGEVLRIRADGTWQTILPGNGMSTPQAMAISPGGGLFVCNGESGSIGRIVDGRGHFFAEVLSYILPLGYLAFLPDGDLYFSEAAPGFQPRLVRISPQGTVREVSRSLDWPAGLAFTPDGTLYAAEYESGEVSRVSTSGQATPLATGMSGPQALAADSAGRLYAAAHQWQGSQDCILRILPDGSKTRFASIESSSVHALAFGANGDLFVSAPAGRQSGVLRIEPDGSIHYFALGYLTAAGLALDLAGNLYVSDDRDNSITRIAGFPQGTLRGRVTAAADGRPIAGATVSVTTDYPVVVGERVTTGSDGRYRLPVAPGTYHVVVSAPGYASVSREAKVTEDTEVAVSPALPPPLQVHLPAILRGR